jgi:hypothetical protein
MRENRDRGRGPGESTMIATVFLPSAQAIGRDHDGRIYGAAVKR